MKPCDQLLYDILAKDMSNMQPDVFQYHFWTVEYLKNKHKKIRLAGLCISRILI